MREAGHTANIGWGHSPTKLPPTSGAMLNDICRAVVDRAALYLQACERHDVLLQWIRNSEGWHQHQNCVEQALIDQTRKSGSKRSPIASRALCRPRGLGADALKPPVASKARGSFMVCRDRAVDSGHGVAVKTEALRQPACKVISAALAPGRSSMIVPASNRACSRVADAQPP
jgi:hypothetical protein